MNKIVPRRPAIASHPPVVVPEAPRWPLEDAAGAARCWGGLAIATLAEIAGNAEAPCMARVAAAGKLLDRGFGPVIAIKGEPAKDAFDLSDEELATLIERAR